MSIARRHLANTSPSVPRKKLKAKDPIVWPYAYSGKPRSNEIRSAGESVTRDVEVELTDTLQDKPHNILLGQYKVQPNYAACELVGGSILHIVFAVGWGPIDAITRITGADGEEMFPKPMPGVTVEIRTGEKDQPALAWPTAGLSSYPGIALVKLSVAVANAAIGSTIPQIVVYGRGLKCLDPRSWRWRFSENPIVQAFEMLTNTIWGAGEPFGRFDLASWQAAANQADVYKWGEPIYRGAIASAERVETNRFMLDLLRLAGAAGVNADGKLYCCIERIASATYLATDATDSAAPAGAYPILGDGQGRTSVRLQGFGAEQPNASRCEILDPTDWKKKPVVYFSSAVRTGAEAPRYQDYGFVAAPSLQQAYRLIKRWLLNDMAPVRIGVTLGPWAIRLLPLDDITVGLYSAIGPLSSALGTVWRPATIVQSPGGRYDIELMPFQSATFELAYDEQFVADRNSWPEVDAGQAGASEIYDDFTAGGTVSLEIGEKGWTMIESGSGSVSDTYSTETGHPGILRMSASANASNVSKSQTISLAEDSRKFAADSTFFGRWIVKFPAQNHNASSHADVAVGPCRIKVVDTVLSYWSGSTWVDTGLRPGATDWVDFSAWGDGAGAAYYSVGIQGATQLVFAIAVSGSTANQTVNAVANTYSNAGSATAIMIDICQLRIPATR